MHPSDMWSSQWDRSIWCFWQARFPFSIIQITCIFYLSLLYLPIIKVIYVQVSFMQKKYLWEKFNVSSGSFEAASSAENAWWFKKLHIDGSCVQILNKFFQQAVSKSQFHSGSCSCLLWFSCTATDWPEERKICDIKVFLSYKGFMQQKFLVWSLWRDG
jgi:hypothetical protein